MVSKDTALIIGDRCRLVRQGHFFIQLVLEDARGMFGMPAQIGHMAIIPPHLIIIGHPIYDRTPKARNIKHTSDQANEIFGMQPGCQHTVIHRLGKTAANPYNRGFDAAASKPRL